MKYKILLVSFLTVLLSACHSAKNVTAVITHNTPVYKQYKIDSTYTVDTALSSFLKPYSQEVKKQMSVIIGETETPLERRMPEGTLGIFVTDAIKQMAETSYKRKVDAAFVNSGGLRVDNISAGPITLGKMYELMPFDNIIVLMQFKGTQLTQLLDFIASKEDWPVAGIKMKIKDKKATNVTINGKPVNTTTVYTIATSDYTANGNEGATFLKSYAPTNNGYLLREALIDYVKGMTAQKRKISVHGERRISND